MIVIDENITIGNPLELFREIERIFRTYFGDQKSVKDPGLSDTPIGGVSKFDGNATGWVQGSEINWAAVFFGLFFLIIGTLGIVGYIFQLSFLQRFGIFSLIIPLAFILIGAVCLARSTGIELVMSSVD